jgi:hypothetical protein
MELVHVRQIPFEALSGESIDVLMLACSGVNKSESLLSAFLVSANRKILFLFCDDDLPAEHGLNEFEIIKFSNNASIEQIQERLNELCQLHNNENIKLVIDYTYMHKKVLGAIVSFLSLHEFACNRLTVYFCYSSPENIIQSASNENNVLQPIILYENYKHLQRPSALIIELNSPRLIKQVNDLYQAFYPAEIYCYIPSKVREQIPTSEIRRLQEAKILEYIPDNIELLDDNLRKLCRQLRLKYRVVIITMGSKLFSMVAFLINARYPDVEIWNYGQFVSDTTETNEPQKYIYQAILSDDFPEDIE